MQNETVDTQTEEQEVKPAEPTVTVTNDGTGTLKADVEPVDPLKEPEENSEDTTEKPQETKEKQEDNKNLESKINEQVQAEDEIKKDLATKGVDFDKLAEEYSNNGSLSQESLDALNKAGYPNAVVHAYLSGLESLSEHFTTQVMSYAGGEEGFNHLTDFLRTQPQEVVNAYNETIQTGNLGQIHLMIDGLMSKMTQAYGTAKPTIMGNGNGSAKTEGYTSIEAMTKDMSDPRYQVDPAFTRSVFQKIKNATIF